MNDIRLIALDLDDTLLRSDLTVSLRTRAALKKAMAKGVVITIDTGRLRSGIDKYVRLLGLQRYLRSQTRRGHRADSLQPD